MTLTGTELDRLAAMATALRPDWPARSVRTLLAADHAHRAYADVAVALAVVATDPATRTPRRLAEHGSWWVAAQAATGTSQDARTGLCPVHGQHVRVSDGRCVSCVADDLVADRGGPAEVRPPDPVVVATRLAGLAEVRAALTERRAR